MFSNILNQMIFLFSLIVIGIILAKGKLLPENSALVLSKLENYLFVPALVLNTFIQNCSLEALKECWKLLLMGVILLLVLIPLSYLFAKLIYKDEYLKKIAIYSLAFSNFGFVGNAIIQVAFPEIFFEYLVFSLVFWVGIYLWGAPVLLIEGRGAEGERLKFSKRIKDFLNPMMIAMIIGIFLGILGWGKYLPKGVQTVVRVSGDCMAPIAMLLTGLTVGKINLLSVFKKWQLHVATIIKLLVYPLLFILIFAFLPQNSFIEETFLICGLCVVAMPSGMNAIVIPAAYGKDTTEASALALITHLLAIGSLPLCFYLLQLFVL